MRRNVFIFKPFKVQYNIYLKNNCGFGYYTGLKEFSPNCAEKILMVNKASISSHYLS